jgi:hypothetical protein
MCRPLSSLAGFHTIVLAAFRVIAEALSDHPIPSNFGVTARRSVRASIFYLKREKRFANATSSVLHQETEEVPPPRLQGAPNLHTAVRISFRRVV